MMMAIIIGAALALCTVFFAKGLTSGAAGILANSEAIVALVMAFGFFLIMASHNLGKKIVIGSITAYILLKVVVS
jgi:hypothetical protein